MLLFKLLFTLGLTSHAPMPLSDVDCLFEAVYFESRGEGLKDMAGVASVLRNRTKLPAFSDSVCEVIAEPRQFSYRNDDAWLRHVPRQNRAANIARVHVAWIAILSATGLLPDTVNGADHFVNLRKARPAWANQMTQVATYSHTFLRSRNATRVLQIASSN